MKLHLKIKAYSIQISMYNSVFKRDCFMYNERGQYFDYNRSDSQAGFRMLKSTPIYPVERYITIGENKVLFNDGSHILYVNGKYRGNDEIGKLMHDFSCTNPDDMNYETLARKARYFKQDKEGVNAMCKMLEDMRKEAELNKAKRTAIRMIKAGKTPLADIAAHTELSLDTIKELEKQTMQLA